MMDQRRLIEARAILDEAIEVHKPTHVFGMLSGGHDSLSATHFVSKYPQFSGAVHINTGIGIRQTREFVYETCKREGWPLREYHPPVSYRDIVRQHGFPGPGGHFYMYVRLKERCIEQLVREHKKGRKDRIMLVTGVRLDESERRMGHVEPIVRVKSRLWVAPILNWSTEDKNNYIDLGGLPRNPVVDQLCMSGECLCGSFAKEGELVEIETAYPEAAATIAKIEAEARAAGVHAKWGTRPPKDPKPVAALPMELCWSCNAKHSDRLAEAAE